MRWRTFTLAGAAALLVAICAATPAAALQGTECEGAETPVRKANLGESERTMLCLLNVHRVANGRAVITHDPALLNAAGRHSRFMEATHQFAHEAIGDGTAQERATASGYPFAVGENIHYSGSSSVTPADILAVFVASPAHNGNILDPLSPTTGTRIVYLTAGMGLAFGPNYGVTTTQMFGVGSTGATDTAVDLLTSPPCAAATGVVESAEKSVAKAKRQLAKADTKKERTSAKKKLRKAKRDLRRAQATEEKQCTLTYE